MKVTWVCTRCGSHSQWGVTPAGEKVNLNDYAQTLQEGERGELFLYCENCGESVGYVQLAQDMHSGTALVYEGDVFFYYLAEKGKENEEEL